MDAPQLSVAASVGAAEIDVIRAPRVAILTTGDEIIPVSATPGPAQIRNSNATMLWALLARRNLFSICPDLGIVRDEPERILSAIREAAAMDVLFITGGMSMGEYDYVSRVLIELGVVLKITKVRMKPGKPFVFGVWEHHQRRTFIFGLPGNPVSAFVCTARLACRLLRRMAGLSPSERWITATLQMPLPPNGPREFYQPAVLQQDMVRPLAWKGSADIFTLAQANALILRPENDPPHLAGETVELMEL